MSTDAPAEPRPGRLDELRASARGWHGIQLAVLGFIGLCGVLEPGDASAPTWLQVLSGLLVLVALALACLATYLVGRAAWPLYGPRSREPRADDPAEIERASRWVRSGLLLTFAAVALLALASALAWWPEKEAQAGQVEVQAADGAWCGQLAAGSGATLDVVTADQGTVQVPLEQLTAVRAVADCG
jgi:hypothetical protein